MCGRFALVTDLRKIAEQFGIQNTLSEFNANWNISVVQDNLRSSSFLTAIPIYSRTYGFLINAPAPIFCAFLTLSVSEKPLTITAFWAGLISRILR